MCGTNSLSILYNLISMEGVAGRSQCAVEARVIMLTEPQGYTMSVGALAMGGATVDMPHDFRPSSGPTTFIRSQ